jgi:phage gpG-like protein
MYFCSQSAGTISAGSGLTAYGYTSDFTNAALEVRLPNNYVGSATTMTVTGLSSTGTTLSISVTVGSGNSTANVGTSQKFVSLSSIGVPSGLGNTLIEIWVR